MFFSVINSIEYGLGSASDYYGFDQLVGSSNFDASYVHDNEEHRHIASDPLYHTSYETFSTVERWIDPDFSVNNVKSRIL